MSTVKPAPGVNPDQHSALIHAVSSTAGLATKRDIVRCRFYLMPGMRCDSPAGHAGPCTNGED